MIARTFITLSLLVGFACQVSAASLPSRQGGVELVERGKHSSSKHNSKAKHRHPSHPKKKHPKHRHPHPHPHPHGKHSGGANATATAITTPSPLATPPTVPVVPVQIKRQIVCDTSAAPVSRTMINMGWSQLHYLQTISVAPDYPYLTFLSRTSSLTNYVSDVSLPQATPVEVLKCTSTYMGYDNQLVPRGAGPTLQYGLVRVPAYDNMCVVATTPGGTPTAFNLAPCSFDDDASQIPQFFVVNVDSTSSEDPYARYLGDTYAKTQTEVGMLYSIEPSTRGVGNAALLNVLPAPSGGPAPIEPSFYFIPA